MGNEDDKGGRASKHDGAAQATGSSGGDHQSLTTTRAGAAHGAADAAARRMAHGGQKAEPLSFVERDGHLDASDSDPTVVGLTFGGGWLVAVSGGKPVSLDKAHVGALHGSRDAAVVEMRAATKGDAGWKLGDHSVGMLVAGDGASALALGEIATGSGRSWKLHGLHGSKDKLPPELAPLIQENDHLDLGGHFYAWMSYPTGSGAENPAGWATTGHTKNQVDKNVADYRADAEKLAEPLRSQVLAHIETISVVSAVEGGYDATSGQVADTSGSLGIFQWARSRNPASGADSIDKFFVRMAQRAHAAEEKLKKGEQPSADERIALDAWRQAQAMGIGVSGGKTTITHGKETKAAGGLDLELAAAGSSGLNDSYQVTQALRAGKNVDGALANLRKHQPKGQSAADEKKAEVAVLDGLIGQLATAARDVLASDLVDATTRPSLEKQLAALEKKSEKKEDAAPADDAAELTALDAEIKDKAARIKAAEPVVRHIIDTKLHHADLMKGEEMRRYQLVAALDWIKEFQANAVIPSYEPYREKVLPHASMDAHSATVAHGGRKLHVASAGGSTVGDHLKSEKAVAEMAMLGVNRPAYVATALWAALQNGDVAAEVGAHLKTIFEAVEKLGGKKGDLTEAALEKLLSSPAPERQADADAASKAMAELKGILWPAAGKEDEGQLITRFRAEAMRIYNTIEAKDAGDNNRVGRFATVELIDWKAVEAAKAKG